MKTPRATDLQEASSALSDIGGDSARSGASALAPTTMSAQPECAAAIPASQSDLETAPTPGINKFVHLTGAHDDQFSRLLVRQIAESVYVGNTPAEQRGGLTDAMIGGMVGLAPRDEVEGMLIGQMLAAHNAAMECHRRAMLPGQSAAVRQENLNQANKLSRTHATLTETLNRHRGKGQQKVTVEHVHVYEGGQAIVGSVSPRGGGENSAKQPHADFAREAGE